MKLSKRDKVNIEKNSMLRLMSMIEKATGKCFHEVLPEVDDTFHQDSFIDLQWLRATRINLEHYLDNLTNNERLI